MTRFPAANSTIRSNIGSTRPARHSSLSRSLRIFGFFNLSGEDWTIARASEGASPT